MEQTVQVKCVYVYVCTCVCAYVSRTEEMEYNILIKIEWQYCVVV